MNEVSKKETKRAHKWLVGCLNHRDVFFSRWWMFRILRGSRLTIDKNFSFSFSLLILNWTRANFSHLSLSLWTSVVQVFFLFVFVFTIGYRRSLGSRTDILHSKLFIDDDDDDDGKKFKVQKSKHPSIRIECRCLICLMATV